MEMRKIWKVFSLAALAMALVAAFAGPRQAQAQGNTVEITIENYAFLPTSMTVAPGTTVRWVNNDTQPHDATESNRGWATRSPLMPGESDSITFNEEGAYTYICSIHPEMTGNLIVTREVGISGGVAEPVPGMPTTGAEFLSTYAWIMVAGALVLAAGFGILYFSPGPRRKD